MMWIMRDTAAHLPSRLMDYSVCLHDHNNRKLICHIINFNIFFSKTDILREIDYIGLVLE